MKNDYKQLGGDSVIKSLPLIDKILITILTYVVKKIYKRNSEKFSIGFVMMEKENTPESKRRNMHVVED